VILSTVGDLYRWDRALRDESVLSAAARAKLVTVVRDDSAYGWEVATTSRGTHLVFHGGYDTAIGVCTGLYRYVDEDSTFIVLANTIMNRGLHHEYLDSAVEALLFGGEVAYPPPAAAGTSGVLAGVVGHYRLSGGGTLEVHPDGRGHLVVSSQDPQAILAIAFPDSPGDGEGPWGGDPRITAVLAGLAHGETTALREVLASDVSADAVGRRLLGGWQQLHEQLGAYLGAKTVHQMWFKYRGAPEVQLYVLLRFARGGQVIRAVRDIDGHLSFDLVRLPEQIEMTFAPEADGAAASFTGWIPKWGISPRLLLHRSPDGAVISLEIMGRAERSMAAKMAS
jgi:hypothetical protein